MRQVASVPMALFVMLVGCQSTSRSALNVYNGVEPTAESPAFHSTVSLTKSNALPLVSYCSGTLIASHLVITAAHCGVPKYVYFQDPESPRTGVFRKVSEVRAHPDYGTVGSIGLFDVAWVRLEESAPETYTPASILPGDSALILDDSLILSGFGKIGNSGSASQIRLQTESTVSVVRTKSLGRGYLETRSPNSSTCRGDSGGSAFVRRSDQWFLAGVISGGSADCERAGATSILVDASYSAGWVEHSSGVDLPGVEPKAEEWGQGGALHESLETFVKDEGLTRDEWQAIKGMLGALRISDEEALKTPATDWQALLNGKVAKFFAKESLNISDNWQTFLDLPDVSLALNQVQGPLAAERLSIDATVFSHARMRQILAPMESLTVLELSSIEAGFNFDLLVPYANVQELELNGREDATIRPVLNVTSIRALANVIEIKSTWIDFAEPSVLQSFSKLTELFLTDSNLSECPVPARANFECYVGSSHGA